MAAKKQAPAAETSPDNVSAPEPTPELAPAPEPEPESAPEPAPAAAPAPPGPVRTYQLPRPEPTRCGGYVLTERGWVLDTTEQEV